MRFNKCNPTFINSSDYHYMQGYEDGIKQGRAEAMTDEEYAKAINDAYNKGVEVGKRDLMRDAMVIKVRADAIDEFTEKLMEEQIFNCMLPDGFRADVVTSHTIDMLAEELKEQK